MSAYEFKLPDVGEGIDAAQLIEWKVAVGDPVKEDEPLAEVETDKAIVVLPCPADGVVAELRFEPGDEIPVGEVIAVIESAAGAEGAPPSRPPERAPVPAGRGDGAASAPQPAAAATGAAAPRRPLASPATRRRARELGVDLAAVAGSGPGGRILREDVEAAAGAGGARPAPSASSAASRTAPSGETRTIPLRGVRKTIAQRLTEAWQTIPHVIDYREVDAGALLEARDALRARAAARGDERLAKAITLTPLIVKITCRALAEHPYANASVDMERGEIALHGSYHIGIATSAPDGLMVPVVRDADGKTLTELALEIAALAEAARERRLAPEQLRGATFTVNNFGALGIWLGTPIINPPEVANLGIGRLERRPVARGDEVVIRPILPLSVSGDHRVLDGDTLAAFVSRMVELMEQPVLLLEEAR
ncbi:MAG: 2-oxo acid dehydrogenase subunit E2 [Thermoleophilaceae bacterium]|nr:2-oxo acid dehydrogenase subunit E2 [Thermoleophilaceae bacterium]